MGPETPSANTPAGGPSPARGRKRPLHDGDEDDIESRKTQLSEEAQQQSSLRFACPFQKRYPLRFINTTCGSGWPSLARLKEHLYRVHQSFGCTRCPTTFKNQEDLLSHIPKCPFPPTNRGTGDCDPGGFDFGTLLKLRNRKNLRDLSAEARWFTMWHTLFPDSTAPDSPYVDMSSGELHSRDIQDFAEFLKIKLPTLMRRELEAKDDDPWLFEAISKCVTELAELYCSTGPAQPGPLPAPRSSSSATISEPHAFARTHLTYLETAGNRQSAPSIATSRDSGIDVDDRSDIGAAAGNRQFHDHPMSNGMGSVSPCHLSGSNGGDGSLKMPVPTDQCIGTAEPASKSTTASRPPPRASPSHTAFTGSKLFCPFCVEQNIYVSIARKSDLKRHIRNFHFSDALWSCSFPDCHMAFDSKRAHNRHSMDVHQDATAVDTVKTICRRLVFACGFVGCKKIYEALCDDEADDTAKGYVDHIAAHFTADTTTKDWSFSVRFRNLLRQTSVDQKWKNLEARGSVEWQSMEWQYQTSLVLRTLLETRHVTEVEPFVEFAARLGSVITGEPLPVPPFELAIPSLEECPMAATGHQFDLDTAVRDDGTTTIDPSTSSVHPSVHCGLGCHLGQSTLPSPPSISEIINSIPPPNSYWMDIDSAYRSFSFGPNPEFIYPSSPGAYRQIPDDGF